MKSLFAAVALALSITPALSVPYCSVMPTKNGLVDYGFGPMTENEAAQRFEYLLRGDGVDAHNTRFWNGCIQTFVKVDGRDEMRFYNPDNLAEIPVN